MAKEETYYEIDWNRVRNLDDLKKVLEAMEFVIPEGLPMFKQVYPYLKGKEKEINNKKQ